MFKNLFTPKQQNVTQQYSTFQMLNNYLGTFTNFSGNAYNNELVRASINAIASHVSKLEAKNKGQKNSKLEYLLNVSPNPYMTAYDMFYKFVTQLYLNNNAFILIQRDDFGNVTGFYPINYSNAALKQYKGNFYLEFTFMTGKKVVVMYEDIIHLRRHFNEDDIYGSNNIILNSIQLLETTNQGIENAIKISSFLRGILTSEQSLNPDAIKKVKDEFVNDYITMNNKSGIAAHDGNFKFTQLNANPMMVDAEQMKIIEDKIFMYYNINKKIVMNEFEENTFTAFYEGVVEPILTALSQELTRKIFTPKERSFKNEIVLTAKKLNYASSDTKIKMVKELSVIGALSINEIRELFGYDEVEDGNERKVSLNYVNTQIADQYQLGTDTNKTNTGGDNDGI